MKRKLLTLILAGMMSFSLAVGCGSKTTSTDEPAQAPEQTEESSKPAQAEEVVAESSQEEEPEVFESTEITVFAAKSLNNVLDELISLYNETQPNVNIIASYDSSGTLMSQIEEGATCDVFFSAAQKQMNQLQDEDNLVVDGTRMNVVNNQVIVVTYKGSETSVTGLDNIADASSLALADGSVPVGKYTRQAMVNAGMLPETEDVSTITTKEISGALGGIEINECANVGAVTAAVSEGSNEVGTVYYSDTYGLEDSLEVLEIIDYSLTGDVIYPIAQIANSEADELEQTAALDFIMFIKSDAAKAVFEKYYFDTNVD